MNTSRKCHKCGLVNFAADNDCRRCQASLDTPQHIPEKRAAKFTKSTIYVLFVLLAAGFGLWAYKYKKESDRELKAKAEFYGRQDYAGHDVNTIPPPGAPTPTPQPYNLIRPEDSKRMEELKNKLRVEQPYNPNESRPAPPSPTPGW